MDTAGQIYLEFSQPIYELDQMPNAFTVTGNEIDPMYAGATPKKTVYKVSSCSLLEDQKTIELIMTNSFRNVVGDVTVAYDDTKGYIAGNGGIVTSFQKTFTPTELKPLYNPGAVENIKFRSLYDLVPVKVGLISTNITETINLNSTYDCIVISIKTKPAQVTETIKFKSLFDADINLVGSLLP